MENNMNKIFIRKIFPKEEWLPRERGQVSLKQISKIKQSFPHGMGLKDDIELTKHLINRAYELAAECEKGEVCVYADTINLAWMERFFHLEYETELERLNQKEKEELDKNYSEAMEWFGTLNQKEQEYVDNIIQYKMGEYVCIAPRANL